MSPKARRWFIAIAILFGWAVIGAIWESKSIARDNRECSRILALKRDVSSAKCHQMIATFGFRGTLSMLGISAWRYIAKP